MKADSVRGRLLIWKNTCSLVAEKPLIGYGPGSFQMVYGKAQASYFATGNGTIKEKRVAGYAEYAFNEYLQLCIEGGGTLLLLILFFGLSVFKQSISHEQYGFCGALFSLAIFAFSSYPLQILPFGITVIILSAACISKEDKETQVQKKYSLLTIILSFLFCSCAAISIYKLRELSELSEQWYKANTLLYNRIYKAASKSYERVYSYLNYHPIFLKNYAISLYSEGKYLEACEILDRAKLISCNSDIWNTQGRYYQAAGYYQSAKHCFEQSLLLTPERLYPYYLLAKLYAEPNFLDKKKVEEMANIVLTKKPKVHSKSVDEMREEMRLLLSSYK